MGKLLAGACPQCEKGFTYYASWPKKYCGQECYRKANWEGKKTTSRCPTCHKEFSYLKTWPRKYCCNVCAGKANVDNIKRFAPSCYTTTCEECGKEYETTPAPTRGRFCSLPCYGKWMSKNVVGNAHPRKGKKFGRAKHLPPPTVIICAVCADPFVVKPKYLGVRKHCSRGCHAITQAENWVGPSNPHWRGGYEPYYGPSWRPAQRATRIRDNVCQDCGINPEALGRELDVHHIVRFGDFGIKRHREANDLSNLICYCPTCHTRNEWIVNPKK